MKASVYGVDQFPLGKKALPDERLNRIRDLYKAAKVTPVQVEFQGPEALKVCDVIVCAVEKKWDLIIQDMEVVEARLEKGVTGVEEALFKRCQACLEKEQMLSDADFSEDEKKELAKNNLVTVRPVVLVTAQQIEDFPALVREVYAKAGRIVFLTGGPKEARAWEIRNGATAVEAAEAIHSDIARGFIRAEVMSYAALDAAGHVQKAKSDGSLRQEGKTYVFQDGDVVEFKFSV